MTSKTTRTVVSLALIVVAIVVVHYYLSPEPIETVVLPPANEKKLTTSPSPQSEAPVTEPGGFIKALKDSADELEKAIDKSTPVREIVRTQEAPEQSFPFWHSAQEILRSSYRAEDLVVAALYDQIVDPSLGGNNFDLAEQSLMRAYHIDANNPLVNHQIMNFCSKRPEYTICTLPYAQNLIQIGKNNATLLNELANTYYQNYDFNQALYLLNKAALVEKSDNYYGLYIGAINNALTFNNIRFMRTRENLKLYPKLARASVNKNFNNVIKMCDERVSFRLEQWRIACRDAGKNIADRSLDYASQGYGVRQYVRYAEVNMHDREQAIRAVAEQRNKIVQELDNAEYFTDQIPYNLWEAFIRDLQDKGEDKAYENLEQKMQVYRRRGFRISNQ